MWPWSTITLLQRFPQMLYYHLRWGRFSGRCLRLRLAALSAKNPAILFHQRYTQVFKVLVPLDNLEFKCCKTKGAGQDEYSYCLVQPLSQLSYISFGDMSLRRLEPEHKVQSAKRSIQICH